MTPFSDLLYNSRIHLRPFYLAKDGCVNSILKWPIAASCYEVMTLVRLPVYPIVPPAVFNIL